MASLTSITGIYLSMVLFIHSGGDAGAARARMPGEEDRYSWGMMVGRLDDAGTHHAFFVCKVPQSDQNNRLQAVKLEVIQLVGMTELGSRSPLVRVVIGEVLDEQTLLDIIWNCPVPDNTNPDSTEPSLRWVEAVLQILREHFSSKLPQEQILALCQLDPAAIRARAMNYVGMKEEAARARHLATPSRIFTYHMLTGAVYRP